MITESVLARTGFMKPGYVLLYALVVLDLYVGDPLNNIH